MVKKGPELRFRAAREKIPVRPGFSAHAGLVDHRIPRRGGPFGASRPVALQPPDACAHGSTSLKRNKAPASGASLA